MRVQKSSVARPTQTRPTQPGLSARWRRGTLAAWLGATRGGARGGGARATTLGPRALGFSGTTFRGAARRRFGLSEGFLDGIRLGNDGSQGGADGFGNTGENGFTSRRGVAVTIHDGLLFFELANKGS